MEYTMEYASPLGRILLACDHRALTGLWLEGQAHFGRTLGAAQPRETEILIRARHWLDDYFAGGAPAVSLPLNPRGTPFQQAVWQQLLAIPYGETRTYGDIAKALARQRGLPALSAQAVGGAVGRNPISLIIPCHRVVGAGGRLTGYAGGLDRKQALLDWESGGLQAPLAPR